MRDVARAAGVSVATVSRVLNGAREVTPASAEAVRRAVRDLGYRPNLLASSLRSARTRSVGIVVPHIANPYFPRLMQAVERALSASDHELLLADSQDDPDLERQRAASLLDRQVDGLLLVPCHEQLSARTLDAIDAPCVLLDRTVARRVADSVTIDDVAGIRAVIAHLRERGRRHLAFVGADPVTSTARIRLETFRAEVGEDAPVLLHDFSLEWGIAAARRLAGGGLLPDAVVCGNDLTAIGVLRGLRDAGVSLPQQVAVTGYDDVGFAEVSHPPLTTVRQPVDAMGEAAVALLFDRTAADDPSARPAGDDPSAHTVVLAPELVIRASTGRAS